MKKIKTIKGSNLIIKYVIKAVIITIFSVFIFSALASLICLKLDIDIEVLQYLSIIICCASAALSGWICIKGFKNNGFALGAISTVPLILFSFVNMIIHSSSGIIFIIKLALCVLIGGLCGAASMRKNKRIKVK